MKTYAANILLDGRKCLVVGGGKVAERKVRSLLDAGGNVTIMSPRLSKELTALHEKKKMRFLKQTFTETIFEKELFFLCIAATDSEETNKQVRDACRKRRILVCLVDNWQEGDFIVPAVGRSGTFTIAVSSAGEDCRGSAQTRDRIVTLLEKQ